MAEEKILDRVQKLINQANDVGLDTPEGKAFAAKADQMMQAHQIEEAALRARNVARGLTEAKKHEPTDLRMDWVSEMDEFLPIHQDVVSVLARLTGVRLIHLGFGKLHVIGYPDDIEYFRMLWLASHLTFSSKLFPEWDQKATAGENIRRFVESGYKWNYIWAKARKEGQPFMRKNGTEEVPEPPNDGGWMKRELKKAYTATGEEKPQLTHGVRNYRNSYANGFGEALSGRVWELIWARQARERDVEGGTALVLKRDVDALTAYVNRLYPPDTLSSGRRQRLAGNHAGAAASGRAAAASVDLSAGRGGVSGTQRQAIG